MEFRVLGPLEVHDDGRVLALGGPRSRALLAFLLLRANEVVSADALLDAVWGEQPPATGSAGLHVRISQLRKVLGADRIETRPAGYVLRIGRGELDSRRFEDLAVAGRRALADGDPAEAMRALDEALALWRGVPLVDVDLHVETAGEVGRLEELRWAAIESRAQAQLRAGRNQELVGELEALIAQQPLRERLREYLMLALYRCGRQADALTAYRTARHTWVEELGIEPGPRLAELERAILNHDPSLEPEPREAAAGAPRRRAERKLVTVLLADVEQEDLERARAQSTRMRDALGARVAAAGGTIGPSASGPVLAMFGAPAAQEDHAERAIRIAEDLVAELRDTISVRVAVETGEVLLDGPSADGPPLRAAMRLLGSARANELCVGERAAAAAQSSRGRAQRARGAFVGREEQVELLLAEYGRAAGEGAARLVTIVGDAGVGKSRLVRELGAALAAEPSAPRFLIGRCLSYGRAVTYRALADVLRELLRLQESDPHEAILEALGHRQILALTLGLDVVTDLHPLAAAQQLRAIWCELLEDVAAERPAVVVIEDLHWAHGDLFDLLEHVLDRVRGPLLLLSTARPELVTRRPSWGRRAGATTLWLEPLAPADAAVLVATAPEHLREVVLERAEGNPFFIEELLARIGEDAAARVPDSVHAVLSARIDELAPAEKEALQAASVIGRVFWREPVRELLEGAAPSFETLEERDFIRPRARSSFEGLRELAFKHALTREVAYGTLTRTRRARMHAGAARWLEQYGGGRDEDAALLAHHYAEAARPEDAELAWSGDAIEITRLREKALTWLGRAADLAVRRYEIDDGIVLLQRMLELEPDDEVRCGLWRAIARANALKFDGEAFWTAMETALQLARDDRVRAEICGELAVESFVRAGMWTRTPALERVGGWITRALELAEPGTASRARALVAKACRDLDDAGAAAEAAAIAERLDDPELCVHAWDACGTVAMAAADYEAAWRWRTRRLALLHRITDPDLRTIVAETPYSACIATCRFEQAREIAVLHEELTRSLTAHHRLHGAAILVEVEELLGGWQRIEELEPFVRETVAANTGTPCLRNARSLLVCAIAAECLGRADAARELEQAADELGLLGKQVLDAPRLRLALVRGDLARAAELLVRIDAEAGWYARGHGTSLATLVTRLDALAALGHGEQVEREAARLTAPGTFPAPFAMRALGVARGDRALLERALGRFAELGLAWHAAQTQLALTGW